MTVDKESGLVEVIFHTQLKLFLISINEQVLIRASRLENWPKKLVRACSFNRHTRVVLKLTSVVSVTSSCMR